MPRNVVVCCDGTANEFARHNTNVVKLYSCLVHDPASQVTCYHPGIGTMEPAGALTTVARKGTKLLGMAIGYGLRMMRGIMRSESPGRTDVAEYFALADGFKTSMSGVSCRPHFVGVWDTVSSVGWIENPLKLPYISDNPDIMIGRHAVAIDERRAFFRNHLWRLSEDPAREHGPRDLEQVWFPGVHCDVGGGYPEAESGLAKIALEWMFDEAEAAGLLVDACTRRQVLGQAGSGEYVPPDPSAGMHESLVGAWNLAEYMPKKHYDWKTQTEGRRMNLHRRRTLPQTSLVHVSAKARGEDYLKRLPPGVIWVGGPASPALSPGEGEPSVRGAGITHSADTAALPRCDNAA